ncbi:MAG: alternative ribosome rescue aminoacyl-tRNA hydrolase ArfB [Planctomycetota bacterium]
MEPLPINARITLPAAELELRFSRSGGPGGQNVNKVETKAELRFCPGSSSVFSEAQKERIAERLASRLTKDGFLVLTASEHRERSRNEEAVRERMANLLRDALRVEKARRATKPTKGSQKRRLEGKRQRSAIKRMRGRGPGDD